ncbi:RNA 2',3'-cyclic phosphodiesterase [bacterium]|nr:RNA 2',3'-cyclic phosphodiesterase [bacterium]
MIRTFIAVNPPTDILKKVVKISEYFQSQTPEDALKWSGINNFHLTLKFLGDVPEKKLPEIKAILAEAAKMVPPFEMSVGGLKFFPNVKKPHAVVLGVQNGQPLAALHQQLDTELQTVGIPGDKRAFNPHLTLARVRRSVSRERAAKIGETLSQFKVDALGPFRIDKVHLYQSELNPKGSIYTPLFTSRLREV